MFQGDQVLEGGSSFLVEEPQPKDCWVICEECIPFGRQAHPYTIFLLDVVAMKGGSRML